MDVRWRVDPELELAIWRPAREEALKAARAAGGGLLLDIGGGGGAFSYFVAENVPGFTPVSIDISISKPCPGVQFVQGDALRLPFKDGAFDMLVARAVLHHFPGSLDEALREASRVLKAGGRFVVQEPCGGNPLASLARGALRTERHDPGERPMRSGEMEAALARHFEVLDARHYFVTSYLAPHAVARLPEGLRPAARRAALAAAKFDGRLLSSSPRARGRAAYVHILTIKRK